MSVLALIHDRSQAAGLANLGRQMAQAIGEPLVLLCLLPGKAAEEVRIHPSAGVSGEASGGKEAPEMVALRAELATILALDEPSEPGTGGSVQRFARGRYRRCSGAAHRDHRRVLCPGGARRHCWLGPTFWPQLITVDAIDQ